MCAKLPCPPNNIVNVSDHAEYTGKNRLTESENMHH